MRIPINCYESYKREDPRQLVEDILKKQAFWREIQLTCSRIQLWRKKEKFFCKEKTLTLAAFK